MHPSYIGEIALDMAKKKTIESSRFSKKFSKTMAVIFKGNRGSDIMTFGTNLKKEIPYTRTIHAETDALYRLPLRNNRKKLKSINICVIRMSKTGKLGNSKPCYHCISTLMDEAPKMGYRIEWILYSNESGEIEKCKLNKFLETHGIFFSSYFKKKLGIPRSK
jgi:cytidine deaminase